MATNRASINFIDPSDLTDFMVAHILQILGTVTGGTAYEFGMSGGHLYCTTAASLHRRAMQRLERSERPHFLRVTRG